MKAKVMNNFRTLDRYLCGRLHGRSSFQFASGIFFGFFEFFLLSSSFCIFVNFSFLLKERFSFLRWQKKKKLSFMLSEKPQKFRSEIFFLFARCRFWTHLRSDSHGWISFERWCFFGHFVKINYRKGRERKEIKATGPAWNKADSRKRQRGKGAA